MMVLTVFNNFQDQYQHKIHRTIKSENNYSEVVKVGLIDSAYTKQSVDYFENNIDTYNTVDGSKNLNLNNGYSHGEEMMKTLLNQTYTKNHNKIKYTLVSTKDKENKIEEQYINNALEYFIKNKVDIVFIPMGTDKKAKTEEQYINELVNNGTIVIASQGNNINETLYPAQYKNVISVSNKVSEDYEYNSKVNISTYDVESTSEAGAYVTNVLANTYNNKFKENINEFMKNSESIGVSKSVKELSK